MRARKAMTFCAKPLQGSSETAGRSNGTASVPTVVAQSVAKIADSVAASGNSDRLLRTIGLDREAVVNSGNPIPYADMMLLSEQASIITRDAAFGLHVGERVSESEYGLIGTMLLTSASLQTALNCLIRYLPIWTNGGVFKLAMEGAIAHFQWEYSRAPLPSSRHDCEMSMASVMRLNRLTTNERWWPQEVWFRHPKPRDTSEHARIFRAPVHFGMPANALLIDRRTLELTFKTSQPRPHHLATKAAEHLLAKTTCDMDISQRVASFIRHNLGHGQVGLEAAAHALGFSRRNLQRRLREESSSYRHLMQQVRRDIAEYLLLETKITSTAAAQALGYSEHSVFHRTFRKWYGAAPGIYRKQ